MSRSLKRSTWWIPRISLCLVLVFSGLAVSLIADSTSQQLGLLQNQYSQAHTQFVAALEFVANSCDDDGLIELAATVRELGRPFDDVAFNIDQLPTQSRSELAPELPANERAICVRVRKLQTDYANKLYQLARKAIKEQHPSFAYRLVREVMRHDSDHAQTRALLGYQRQGKEWTTPFAIDMKKEGMVWHEEFGWLPSKHVTRYENGERFYNGKWMTAAREEALRSDFDNGWEIKTEHFFVKTNHSQQKGVELAVSTEAFRQYFMREFAAFFKKPQQLEKLFSVGPTTQDSDLHEIWYFRQRQEFVNRLAAVCPIAGEINGFYMPEPEHRRAYFFHNPDLTEEQALDTLYHEVTHQLLSESTTKSVSVGHERDFWVVEGIACYFESFRVAEDGTISVGDVRHDRLHAAMEQVITSRDQEPLIRFTAMGMLAFQRGELFELQKRYAQAAGLTHFLMHSQGGAYRDGFIEYLSQVYSPDQRVRNRAKTLEQILGVPFTTLDKQYIEHFQSLSQKTPKPIAEEKNRKLPLAN